MNVAFVASPGIAEIAVILVFGLIGFLLTVVPFWKICSKAGFPGPLSLLMLIPIANIILLFYIAFAPWPALGRQGS
jgi:hypothetical protein